MIENPFVIGEYKGPEYFCDRVEETARLIGLVNNGNNVVLTATRRVGKTDIINHIFNQDEIKERYIPILVDIYATQSLAEFVAALGEAITEALRGFGKAIVDGFVNFLYSIRSEFSFDSQGIPVWGVGLNYNKKPDITLKEIFKYIESAHKPCLIAIDEFQKISTYQNGDTVEALLRTHIQRCHNARFIYAGSQRHLMAEIFATPSRPFFQSASLYGLPRLDVKVYAQFCKDLFSQNGKTLSEGVTEDVYQRFDGITLYMQKVMNEMFNMTPEGGTCEISYIDPAINQILDEGNDSYTLLLYQMTQRQRDLMIAIAQEGEAKSITSGAFIKKHHLPSQSSVSSTAKLLLEKDFLTRDQNTYMVYDRLFSLWLRRRNSLI